MKIRTAVFRLIHQKREAVINIRGEGECPQNKETLFRYDQVIKLTVLAPLVTRQEPDSNRHGSRDFIT